jgi:hypothetical protein
MSNDAFKQGLVELYQGEVLGEVLFNQLLPYFDEPDKHYKIAVMLQLETETKARLRPAMMQLGLDLGEQNEFRQMGLDMATGIKDLSWEDTMVVMRDSVKPVVERYREIAADAPSEHRELAESMVIHEKSIYDFAVLELAGEGKKSIDAIVTQLQNRLPSPQRLKNL